MAGLYNDIQRRLLGRYFSTVDAQAHADVFLVRNLPPEVAATLEPEAIVPCLDLRWEPASRPACPDAEVRSLFRQRPA